MTDDFKRGADQERSRVVGGLRSILDAGGGLQEVRAYLDALDARSSALTQLHIMDATVQEDFRELANRLARSLDAHNRYLTGSHVETSTGMDGTVTFTLTFKDRTVLIVLETTMRVDLSAHENRAVVLDQDFGIVDLDDTDVLFEALRQQVLWVGRVQ